MEPEIAEHWQYRSTVGIKVLVRMTSGMITTQLADRRSKWMTFIGFRRDSVLSIVTKIDVLRRRVSGTDKTSLLTKTIAVVNLQFENSNVESKLAFEL